MRQPLPAALLAVYLLSSTAAFASCPGYSSCPVVNYPKVAKSAPAQAERASIDVTEASALSAAQQPGLPAAQLQPLLGEVLAFDKSLSVSGNEACTLCHSPATGFSGGISALSKGGGVFFGSDTHRTGNRSPQSLAYAAFAPVLSYDKTTASFTGGNFWDSRATGLITGTPSGDQATMPFTNPAEMGLPDPACVVRRVSLAPYAPQFTQLFGSGALAITWPANTDKVCAKINNGGDQAPLALSDADRATATSSLNDIGVTIASYEQSAIASPFTSKFDAVQAGTATFTDQEALGFGLFGGRGKCRSCHTAGAPPYLFTAFNSFNIGTPRNLDMPYLREDAPDKNGYVANPDGANYVDPGLGGFLSSSNDTNPTWQKQAKNFMGTFQVPTLRNVALVPAKGFKRAYGHNGFFTSLKEIVHFYNTRDVLPQCTGTSGVGVSCWPAPETKANENTSLVGNLGLSSDEEDALVAFMGTLTDGYSAQTPVR